MPTLPDFNEPAWNDRRIALQNDVLIAIGLLVTHMGGGVPVAIPVKLNGTDYVLHMDRVPCDRRMN